MTFSQRCVDLVKSVEGCELTCYLDPVGIPTVGYGHTGAPLKVGDIITQQQADAFLESDLTRAAMAVNEGIRLPVNQNQFDALCSFCYNVGARRWLGSTLRRLCDQGQWSFAADQFPLWVHGANMVTLPGLVKRRAAERNLFLETPAPAFPPPSPPISPLA